MLVFDYIAPLTAMVLSGHPISPSNQLSTILKGGLVEVQTERRRPKLDA